MEPARISLLGPLKIELAGAPLRLAAPPMTFPLLGYLLLHRTRTIVREALAFTLWSDYEESEAKLNLRRHLYHLQQVLPPTESQPWLLVDAKTVRWNPAAPAVVDIDDFQERIRTGDRAGAASLYAGDFLEQHEAEWILPERERLRALHTDNLLALVAESRSQRQYQRALTFARLLQRCDPWREDALRECASLRYELGDGAGAIAELDAFARRLRDELDAEMMPETVALRNLIAREQRRRGDSPVAARDELLSWRVLPFVGRTRELDALQRAWERARDGAGSVVVVEGEAGIGKSRIVAALRASVVEDGGLVLDGATTPESPPYQPVIDALAGSAAEIAVAQLPAISKAALAAIVPDVRARAPDLPALPPLTPEREQARLHEAFSAAIAALAEQRPVLLLIEDVHWAGAATIGLIEAIAQNVRDRKVLLVLTYRSEDVAGPHVLRMLARDAPIKQWTEHIALAPLATTDVDRVFRLLAGREVAADDVAAALHQRSDGNPFFLSELMRDAVERGVLHVDGERVTYDADSEPYLSIGIREVMKARLQRISAPSRRMLDIAAVIGRSFGADLLREVARATDASATRAILELSDRQLIVERPERRDYTFTHQLLQSAAYELIPPVERRAVHLHVAKTLESLSATLDEVAPLLAAHFERGGDDRRAAAYHLRAARHTLSLNADAETRYHCERCLALSADRTIRAEALLVRETVHRRAAEREAQRIDLDELTALQKDGADPDRALEVLRRRAALCYEIGDRDGEASQIAVMRERAAELASPVWSAHALHAEGRRCVAMGRFDAARAALERALSEAQGFGDARLSAEICCELSFAELHAGEYAAAEGYSERAIALARDHWSEELAIKIAPLLHGLPHRIETPERTYRLSRELLQRAVAVGDQHETMEARLRAGTAAMVLFRISEADEHLRLAEQLADRVGTPKWRCNIAVARGVLAYCMGDFDTACAFIERAKVLGTRSGDRFTELLCDADIASVWLTAGDAQRALDTLAGCDELVAEVDSDMLTAVVQCVRGSAMCRLGLPEGLPELERGVAAQRELSRQATFGNDLAELALAYVARGNVPAALQVADELERLSETTYCGVAHPELMLLAAARAWEAAGDLDRSRDLLAKARERLRQHVEQIDDPRLKQSFLAMTFNRELQEQAVGGR